MKASKLGILSALIASACCIGPLVLILLGLGSLGIGAAIGKYHWYFIAGALVLIIFAWRSFFKEKKTCNLKGCQMENKRVTLITLIIVSLIVAIFAALNVYTYAVQRDYSEKRTAMEVLEAKTLVIPVTGMTCFSCEIAVSSALKRVEGVIKAEASAKHRKVRVVYDPMRTDVNQLLETINRTGYRAGLPN